MSLSTRITLVLVALLAASALAGHLLHRKLFFDRFEDVERIEVTTAAQRVQEAIAQEIRELDRDSVRFAHWDELYDQLERPRGEFDSAHLAPESLEFAGIDLVVVVRLDGTVVVHHASPTGPDGELHALREFPRRRLDPGHPVLLPLLQQLEDGDDHTPYSGVLRTEHVPLLFSARAVRRTDGTGRRRGIAIVGRFLTEQVDEALEARLGFALEVWPLGSDAVPADVARLVDEVTSSPTPVVTAVGSERLDVLSTLDDHRRRPEFIVRTRHARRLGSAAQLALSSGLLQSLTLALGLLLALLILLRALVLRPLSDLTRSVVRIGETDALDARVASGRTDEIGTLAREFDQMLGKLERARAALVDSARAAGMSEIATGILHNVGNVLNSVSISATVVGEKVEGMCVDDLRQIVAALDENADDLAKFLTEHPQGRHLRPFLAALVAQLGEEHDAITSELRSLSGGIEHICELVKSQQGYARAAQVVEPVDLAAQLDEAVRLTEHAEPIEWLEFVREYEDVPRTLVDRHKVLEILVNLVQNARQAVADADRGDGERHRIDLRVLHAPGGRARVEVRDSGVGIDPENLTQVFQMGFTTKTDGHGFGLHASANAASEIGGELHAESAGPSKGAAFVLELPVRTSDSMETAA